MQPNIPESSLHRVVIAGAGFAGLKLARLLSRGPFQVVLLDRNNYHQFQPLFYQVATSGLEASSISFPLRKVFQRRNNVHIRMAEILGVDTDTKLLRTSSGTLAYDSLVLCMGLDTNYYGLKNVESHSFPMKSVTEAVLLRNAILENYEAALTETDVEERGGMMSIGVVGGGPTGVELSGALAEMKRFILPKDYPELNFDHAKIWLIESSDRILGTFSERSTAKSLQFLQKLGVTVMLNARVTGYDGKILTLADGRSLKLHTLIWAAGVEVKPMEGLPPSAYGRGKRILTDGFSRVYGCTDVYAIGDMALMKEEKFPDGHPQVAQVALQQAVRLAYNLRAATEGDALKPFAYSDPGSMATIGRNKAVVELPFARFRGFFAWLVWTFIHLMAIVGVKNRLLIFINWAWGYFSYDRSFRLIYKLNYRKTQGRD